MEGKILKELRELHNMTQKELADKVQVTPKAISFYELNQREPSNELLKSFSKIFNVSIDYLLGNDVIKNEVEDEFEDPEIKILARSAKTLTPEQLKAVQAIIDSYEKSKMENDDEMD